MRIEVLDAITSAGSPDRFNEDSFGHNSSSAFVIDGATGLGKDQIIAKDSSDAAWISAKAASYFAREIVPTTQITDIVRSFIVEARTEFFAAAQSAEIPAYAKPSSSFAMLRVVSNGLEFAGLGDCSLYVGGNNTVVLNPLPKFAGLESDTALKHIKRAGGFKTHKNLLKEADALSELRAVRSLQNTDISGIWTLGLEAQAADHLCIETINASQSFDAILCSDGFSALVDAYQIYGADDLINAANSKGLQHLMDELRHFETNIDPDGFKSPRFKASDDATAMLLSVIT